ncbi:hypothetical protein LUZ60_014521 [Juncus effusus]|nr:hypothetical protein LUZ60_014521 [Juncus effusus]
MKLLNECKSQELDNAGLVRLQERIEDLTLSYKDGNIFEIAPNLLEKLISLDLPSAKEYLKDCLSDDYLPFLNALGRYTLEGLMIHVLAFVFHCIRDFSAVKVSTFLSQLDSVIKDHACFLNVPHPGKVQRASLDDLDVDSVNNKKKSKSKRGRISKATRMEYEMSTNLIQFMEMRDIIHIFTDVGIKREVVCIEPGKVYIKESMYMVCNFDLTLLPVKLSLPMVCRPLNWKPISKVNQSLLSLSDCRGGYLCAPTASVYNNIHLLTSHDIDHFDIRLTHRKYKEFCGVLNGLQSQGFHINSDFLSFLERNHQSLVDADLLMPKVLSRVNLKEATDLLRYHYFENVKRIKKMCSINTLLTKFLNDVQESRFETFIITLASAYNGYQFYLPTFLDFRGRIYRSGVLHFHERDLAIGLDQSLSRSVPNSDTT